MYQPSGQVNSSFQAGNHLFYHNTWTSFVVQHASFQASSAADGLGQVMRGNSSLEFSSAESSSAFSVLEVDRRR